MKVLVTGVKGQLGYDVVKELEKRGHQAVPTDREELDIANQQAVTKLMHDVKPDAVIHCAAYTNVDAAEEQEETAYAVNALGAKYLAEAAKQVGAKILYVSTDYVFDGNGQEPYVVDYPTSPLGVYGETKLAGEQYIQASTDEFFIVRTAWVFGLNGNNFVKTMLRLGREKNELGVVHDQVGSPTYTKDLARLLVDLVETDKYGVYHGTNEGVCSWYEFAVEIFNQAGLTVKVNPLTSDQFPRPAKRPSYSVLDKSKLAEQGFQPLPNWQDALARYLSSLAALEN